MAQAQGNNVITKYVVETTQGTTPAAALTILPVKTSNLNAAITTVTSAEIRNDRAEADLIRTTGSTTGDVGFELGYSEYKPFFEAALGGTLSTAVALTATDISAASADNSYNSVAAAFSTANILPGMWIKVKGFATAANNGISKVVSVTTAKIVVSHKTLVTEAAGPSVTLNSESVRNGNTKKSFSIEKEYSDLTTTFSSHKGCIVNTLTLNASSGAIVEGSIGFMGMVSAIEVATIGTGADVTPAATGVMSATANVGTIFIDGVALSTTYLKNINLSINNNARQLDAIGNLYPISTEHGTMNATMAISAFFNDATQISKFLAGTAFSLSYSFVDDAGNYVVLDFPVCKYNTGTITGAAINTDLMTDLNATALLSSTLGYVAQVSFLPA